MQVSKLFPALILGLVVLSGCAPRYHYHGHQVEPETLQKLKLNRSTKSDVIRLLGSPTIRSDFGQDTWFYIYKITKSEAFFAPEVLIQDVVGIQFHKTGVISNIAKKSLKDAEAVDLVERITPTTGQKDSALKQIFGNFGRVARKDTMKH